MKNTILYIILTIAFTCNLKAQKQISINFAGNINFGHWQTPQNTTATDTTNIFGAIQNTINKKVPIFSTLGTIFLNQQKGQTVIPVNKNAISIHSDYARILAQNGFIAISAANKNIGEYGFEGLASTTDALRNNGIMFAGIRSFCESTIIQNGGTKIGFAAFGNNTYTISINDSVKIAQTINHLDTLCDIVVIAFSINKKDIIYTKNNNKKHPYMRLAEKFAQICIDSGADIVYGDGEDTPQSLDLYKDRLIMYGLGNFCTPTCNKYNEETSCAPIISVNTYSDGTFCNAKIHSFKQINNRGPQIDKEQNAIRIIRKKTQTSNPETRIIINDDGTILSKTKSNTVLIFEVLNEGQTHLGKKYKRGAVGPNIFDCSGFTSFIFRKIGIELNRTSASQYQQGVKVNKEDLKPGDLVFFSGSVSRHIGHVGVVTSVDKTNRSFKFIHASNRGVVIDDFAKSSYYIRRYVGATRIIGHIGINE